MSYIKIHLQVLVDDFICALRRKALYQGRMYIFDHYLCFYSKIFNHQKIVSIPLKVFLLLYELDCNLHCNTAFVHRHCSNIKEVSKSSSSSVGFKENGQQATNSTYFRASEFCREACIVSRVEICLMQLHLMCYGLAD